MAETLGSLVDKLTIVNLKLWFVQDQVHKCAASGADLPAEKAQQLTALNLQRNGLMSEIDALLRDAIDSGVVPVDPRVKLL